MMTRSGTRALVSAGLLDHPRYEVIPTASIEEAVCHAVPKDVTVTVTASPTKGLDATLDLAEALAGHGYRAVPHVSARLIVDEHHLQDIMARLGSAGIDDVFLPAGDADPPAGRFEGALAVLALMAEQGRPFARVGITGYPQSHPRIGDDLTIQAMWDKRQFADYIVSNLCLDPGVLRHWVRRVRARGVVLPLRVGLAGPIDRTKLVSMAAKIGIGESTRFASRHLAWFAKMGAPGGYQPDRFLDRVGGCLVDPASLVEGLHIFTFNQVRETEAWRQSLLARARSLSPQH
ncbi:MAG: methylenetetrahydrofolate reductase [Acidimicrobiales bacterium]